MARTAPDAYTLLEKSVFLPFVSIVEGGGGVKDAIKALATNSNFVHRQIQKVYACQDSQEQAETEYLSLVTAALVGAPDLLHVWYLDHLLSDADLKMTLHYKTTDGGAGGQVGVKAWLVEADGGTYEVFDVTLDNAAWTTSEQTMADPWDLVDDPTAASLLVLGIYEVDVGASFELKHVTAESVADAVATVAEGVRSSGYVPHDDEAFDANSPLDVAHVQQLLDSLEALQADKTGTFMAWSEYLSEPAGDFLKSSALSDEWARIAGPFTVEVMPGRTLKFAVLGYGEHAGCKFRVFTGHEQYDPGMDGVATHSFPANAGAIDPQRLDHWTVGELTLKDMAPKMSTDEVYVEWITPDDGMGAGRNTAILGICFFEV